MPAQVRVLQAFGHATPRHYVVLHPPFDREVIGAQTLINAGLPNKVAALENGTMAWLFEGYELRSGERNAAPAPVGADLDRARSAVGSLTARFGLRWLDAAGFAALRAEAGERTLYLFDVRTQSEFEAEHLRGSRWAEGGQLVQGIDKFAPVRNARIVVIDDANGVRAAITASWLVQMGWAEVFAYAADLSADDAEVGAGVSARPASPLIPLMSPHGLHEVLAVGKFAVLDLAPSLTYEAGHIPGARFAVRSRLNEKLDALDGKNVVLVSPDGILAAHAFPEVALLLGENRVWVLEGGTDSWRRAGLPIERANALYLHEPDDIWRSPYQEAGDRHAAFRAYLKWEIDLLDQIRRDPAISFAEFR